MTSNFTSIVPTSPLDNAWWDFLIYNGMRYAEERAKKNAHDCEEGVMCLRKRYARGINAPYSVNAHAYIPQNVAFFPITHSHTF